jgi:hypothetical protein
MAVYKIGDLATWTYRAPQAHDKFPKVLVLHDNWEGKVHGLNLNYLTDDEINFLRIVLNVDFAKKELKKFIEHSQKWNNKQLLEDLKNIEGKYASLNIMSPRDFYVRFVRGFIKPRGWDPYRLYRPEYIIGPRVLRKKAYFTGNNPRSMFSRFIDTIKYRRGRRFFS